MMGALRRVLSTRAAWWLVHCLPLTHDWSPARCAGQGLAHHAVFRGAQSHRAPEMAPAGAQ